jgi:hypothetical protein
MLVILLLMLTSEFSNIINFYFIILFILTSMQLVRLSFILAFVLAAYVMAEEAASHSQATVGSKDSLSSTENVEGK